MQARGVGRSVTGTEREFNEDSFLIDDELGLYVLADGIGGRSCGEIASAVTVRSISSYVADKESVLERIKNKEADEQEATKLAEEAVQYACEELQRNIETHRDCAVMGSTVTLVIVLGKKAVMAHVGNTRLYLYRNGSIHQLSNDHTIPAEYLRRGIIGEDEISNHPYKKVLTRSIGRQTSVIVDTLLFDILPKDKLLLCSNGLNLPIDEPLKIGSALSGDLALAPDKLIDLALVTEDSDDATVVVIEPDMSIFGALKPQLTSFMPDAYFDLLGSVSIFKGLSLSQLQRIRNISRIFFFDPGEVIVEEKQPALGMYLVLEGSVDSYMGTAKYRELRVGDYALENMLLQTNLSGVTLKARERTRVLVLERSQFEKFTRKHPQIGVTLMNHIAERLAEQLGESRSQ